MLWRCGSRPAHSSAAADLLLLTGGVRANTGALSSDRQPHAGRQAGTAFTHRHRRGVAGP